MMSYFLEQKEFQLQKFKGFDPWGMFRIFAELWSVNDISMIFWVIINPLLARKWRYKNVGIMTKWGKIIGSCPHYVNFCDANKIAVKSKKDQLSMAKARIKSSARDGLPADFSYVILEQSE